MFKTLLVSIDATVPEEANALLKTASDLAKGWGSDLHVCTMVPDVYMAIVGTQFSDDFEAQSLSAASDELAELCRQAGVKATPHVRFGTVYDRVIALAGDLNADLIVVGGSHPDLKDYLLGSNASRIVRHANTSVLVLRAED